MASSSSAISLKLMPGLDQLKHCWPKEGTQKWGGGVKRISVCPDCPPPPLMELPAQTLVSETVTSKARVTPFTTQRWGAAVTNSPRETNQPSSVSPDSSKAPVRGGNWGGGGQGGRKRASLAPHLPGWLRIPGEVLEVDKGAGSVLHVLGLWAIVTPWLLAAAASLGERSSFSTKCLCHRSWTGSQSGGGQAGLVATKVQRWLEGARGGWPATGDRGCV